MRRALLTALAAVGILGGANAALTGQIVCSDELCVTATRDSASNTDTYFLQPVTDIPHSHFGWMAVGFGMHMVDSPMVIMWPNEDGTFTYSQREAHHHVQPSLVSFPQRTATLLTDNCWSNETSTGMGFTMLSNDQTSPVLIWALSNTNPQNSDPNANLIEHTWRGLLSLELNATWTGEKEFQSDPAHATHSPANKKNGKPSFALIAHITCGVLVTMLVLPGGVVVPRITRGLTTSKWWFRFHQISQGIIALALMAAGLGIALRFGGELDSRHRKTGVALFSLTCFQILLGLFSHMYTPGWRVRRYTFETKRGRGPTNFLHVIMGIIIVAVGWSTCWTGLTDEWHRRGHGVERHGLRVGWGIITMFWMLAYVLGIIFLLPRQLRIESAQRETARKHENEEVYRSSAVALANEYFMQEQRNKSQNALSSGDMTPSPDIPSLSSPDLPQSPSAYQLGSYPHSPSPDRSPNSGHITNFQNSSTFISHFANPGAPIPPAPSKPEGLDGDPFEEHEATTNLSAVTIPIQLAPPSKPATSPLPPPRSNTWSPFKRHSVASSARS